MAPPAVLLCLQLAIGICIGSSWALPASSSSTSSKDVDHNNRPPQLRLEALFPGGGKGGGTSSTSSSSVGSRSKRQPSWMPTLIDSGDDNSGGFAYRQHHQPPPGLHRQHSGYQHHPHQQQQQQQHRFRLPPPEDFPVEDYDQTPDQDHSSAEDQQQHQHQTVDNEIGDVPFEASPGSAPATPIESIDLIREQLERVKEEEDIEIKSELLMKLLEQLPEGPLPIVYIEDAGGSEATVEQTAPAAAEGGEGDLSGDQDPVGQVERFTANGDKRSGRYYRRYPWKRQNARARTYDADARYLCVPSREDVFKLLVGLHENRIGNHQKTINFCNRKRPAKAIFTNIRFLG